MLIYSRRSMSRRYYFLLITLPVSLLIAATACSSDPIADYYAVGESSVQRENRRLLSLLDESENPDRAIVVRRLAGNLREEGYTERMVHLLTTQVERNPDDPYNGYYLFLIGRAYQRSGNDEFARRYFRRSLNDYPDVDINGSSVHFAALDALSGISEDPRHRIGYYEQLLDRFPSRIDEGRIHYYMGRTYENLVDWDRSRRAYERFLALPNTEIPGASDAHSTVRRKLQFARSSRDWTFESLEELVDVVRTALANRDSNTLRRYQTGVDFFAASPQQDPTDANSTFGFNIEVFLSRSNVQTASEFSVNSNDREAYLQTTGWAERFSTWYFYFRRIDFPADPEVHGNWEWAGIRFGEVH